MRLRFRRDLPQARLLLYYVVCLADYQTMILLLISISWHCNVLLNQEDQGTSG